MSDPWYVDAFRAGYLDVYAHRDDGAAASEVAFPAEVAGVRDGAIVLDAGCGAGRHARALAERGLRVTGIDLSGDLLAAAASKSTHPLASPHYVRADLRALPFAEGSFDAVLSFFTSFGYFDDADNLRHASELRRVLRPGRRLVLDFLHAPRVRATLVARSRKECDGTTIIEQRALRAGRVEKDVTMTAPDGSQRQWRESVRLYDPDELDTVLVAAGFRVVAHHGDLCGAPLGAASLRCVVVAEAA